MADQLQFRGGTTAQVNAASVASREIIIDTQTNEIAVGASKVRTVMQQSNGNVNLDGRFTAAGNVAIGTTSPQKPLVIVTPAGTDCAMTLNEGTTANPLLITQTATEARIQTTAAQPLVLGTQSSSSTQYIAFETNSIQRAAFTGDGNLGIGGTIPSAPNITLAKGGTITASSAITAGGNPDNGTATGTKMAASGYLRVARASGSLISTYTTGNPNPTFKVDATGVTQIREDVAGGLGGELRLLNVSATSPGSTVAIKLQPTNNSGRYASIEGEQDPGGQTRVNLLFKTAYGGTPVERMRLTSDGKLGIGTQDPQAKLHLRGDSTTKIWLENTANGSSTFNPGAASIDLTATAMNATSKYTPSINFGSTDAQFTTTNPKFGAAINAQASQSYSSDTTGGMDLVFWTSPINPGTGSGLVQRMMIDTGGNVGINTNTPQGKLTVEGSQNADPTAAKNPIGDIYIQNLGGTQGLNNYGGSLSFSRINKTRRGAMIAEVQTSTNVEQGGLAFFTKSSTTASTDLVVERVRIDHNGQVDIGGTLPSAPAITLASAGDITAGGDLLLESGTGNNCTISTTVANGNDSHLSLKKARGVAGDVQDADSIGTIDFSGYYGSAYQTESLITCKAVIGASYSDKLQYFSNRHDFVTSNNTRMTIDSSGVVGIGGTLPSAPNITLASSGTIATTNTITAGSSITSGGNPASGANTGTRMFASGELSVSKASGGAIKIYTTGNSTPTFTVNSSGAVTSAGDIACTDNSKGLVLKSPDGTSFRLSVANDGTLSAASI